MAKRRQWKDELKPQRDTCEDDEKKKRKIEIISDVIYKYGKPVRSKRYLSEDPGTNSEYYLPEQDSFPPTPHKSKSTAIGVVKDLTPTFRKPKYYISETKRIIENIPSTHIVPHSNNNFTQSSEHAIINDVVNKSDLEDIAQIVQPIMTTSTIAEVETNENLQNRYDVLVTFESDRSDHSLESPEMFQNLKTNTVKESNSIDSCIPHNDAKILHNSQYIKDHTGVNTVQVVLETNNNLFLDTQIHPCGVNVTSEENVNLPQIDLNCPNQNFTDICKKPLIDAQLSPHLIKTLPVTDVSPLVDAQLSPNKIRVVPEIDRSPLLDVNLSPILIGEVPVTYGNPPVEVLKSNHSDEQSQDSKYNRKCKKKLNFDKIYLDFIEEDDADTLLLNEAFPSEDSSASYSQGETSDDSASSKKLRNKTKKQRKNSKRGKGKIIKKKNNSKNAETKEEITEQILKTRPKKKQEIKNDNKMKRILGQSFTSEKGEDVPSKTMKPNPCKDIICKRNCGEITEERRQRLFTYYWNLGSTQRQKDWISQCAIKKDVKCYTTDKGESSRRNFSYAYYINEDDGRRQVCQKFLLNTLDITQRLLLYTLNNAVEGFAKLDERRQNGGGNKTKEEVTSHAEQFIKSLPLVPSHYCRKDSTRLYLPDDLKNISNLYRIYSRNCVDNDVNKMSFKVFSSWLKTNYNIGFHVPKKDKCMTCMIQTYDVKNEEELLNFESHLREKNESYKRFQCHQKLNAKDSSIICASFDMQKVLNTPHGENMALYYSRKIAVYNMTIYESNTQVGYCNLWTEVDAHRGANEISTCVFKYLQEVDERQNVKKVLLYSDSCYGQNKNKTMLSMLRYFLSKSKNIDVIQMNYLIPGHTFMPVDSMHATIERAVKKTTIWAPSHWPIAIEMARKNPAPYIVSILEGKDFMGFEDILNSTFKKNQKLQISKLCIATFKKSNPDKMIIKYSMLPDAEATEVTLCSLNGSEPKYCLHSAKLPVSLQKYNDLKKLVDKNVIPRTYAKEYLCLKRDKKVQDALNESDEEDENQ